jgi:hypothetical protein
MGALAQGKKERMKGGEGKEVYAGLNSKREEGRSD